MSSMRVLFVLSALFVALAGACGGTSDAPPQANPGLPCLAYPLTSFCCEDAGSPMCVGDFASAQKCSSWPAGSKALVYPSACHGLVAVAHTVSEYTSLSIYDASGALYAVGDDAATNHPGSLSVECGAGPEHFTVPTDCAATWLDATQGQPCSSGSSTPTFACH